MVYFFSGKIKVEKSKGRKWSRVIESRIAINNVVFRLRRIARIFILGRMAVGRTFKPLLDAILIIFHIYSNQNRRSSNVVDLRTSHHDNLCRSDLKEPEEDPDCGWLPPADQVDYTSPPLQYQKHPIAE